MIFFSYRLNDLNSIPFRSDIGMNSGSRDALRKSPEPAALEALRKSPDLFGLSRPGISSSSGLIINSH